MGIITNLNCGKKFKICALAEKMVTVWDIADGIIPLEFLELSINIKLECYTAILKILK